MDGFDLGSIVAHIRAETTQFTAAMEQAKAQADGVATHMSTIAGGVALAVDAIVVGFGVMSVRAFAEGQTAMAQLEQVLKTTGKSSELSAEQVHKMALSLEEYSGQSHIAIEQGQTILLQFAGISKDTLPQASRAMVDLAQRMGVDTVTAAKQLGIAIDDPEVGITRLRRSGIDFTESQKEAIKSLKASGDTAGAAALLMSVLETKVGGAAGAYRNTLKGSVEEAKLQLKDFEEGVGKKLVNWLTDAFNWYQKNSRVVNDFAGVIGTLLGVIAVALILYGNWIVLTKTLAIVQAALNLIMDMNPIVLSILAVVFVAALLLEHWKTVKQWFGDFTNWLKQHWDMILGFIFPFLLVPIEIIKHWETIVEWFKSLGHLIKSAVGNLGNLLFDVGKAIIQGLINGLENMVGAVEDKVKSIAKGIKDVAKKILGIFSPSTVFHDMGMNIGQGLINGMNAMTDMVGAASGSMAIAAVAPASNIVNNAGSSSTINTSITGPINIGSNVDANRFLAQLTYNQELAQKGLTPVR